MTITGPGATSVPSHVQPVRPAQTQATPQTEDVTAFQQKLKEIESTKAEAKPTNKPRTANERIEEESRLLSEAVDALKGTSIQRL